MSVLGYVRPVAPELRVRENELYRAVYCGLCRSMGKCTGCASRLTLSYDFAFLALVRYALTDTSPTVARGRCIVHPLRARYYAENCDALTYSAAAAALLMRGKISDDIADEHGLRHMRAAAVLPFVSRFAARAEKCGAPGMDAVAGVISRELSNLSALERGNSSDIDACADTFGNIMAAAFAGGLDGAPARIAAEIGRYTGRFIYVCDAADDIGDDARLGRFNPLLSSYGADVLERRTTGDLRGGRQMERTLLPRDAAEGVLTAARLDLHKLWDAFALVSGADEVRGIIENIISLGMTSKMIQALGLVPPDGEKNKRL